MSKKKTSGKSTSAAKKEIEEIYNMDAPAARGGRRSEDSFVKRTWTDFLRLIRKKREERLTLMFIPHNEDKIKNFHISNLALIIIVSMFSLVVLVNALFIINHTSTVQEVDKLKISQKDASIQFSKIRSEIKDMEKTFSGIRYRLSNLHAMAQGKSSDESNLYGQGGASIPIESANDMLNPVEGDGGEEIPMEIFMLNRISGDLEISRQPLHEIEDFLKKRSKIIQSTPTLWPVEGYIINPYGFIRNADTLNAYYNPGVDIAAPLGSEVAAAAHGIVIDIKKENSLYTVRIRHNYGYETVYKGLDRVSVQTDDKISKAETIGYLGINPQTLQSALHYQIYVGVEAQNPMPYLSYISDDL